MTDEEKHTKAIEFFKDWSNYLLVTTVAALGWASSASESAKPAWAHGALKPYCIWFLALSVVFGIFTLALIPLVQEQRKGSMEFHAVATKFWATKWFTKFCAKKSSADDKCGLYLIWVCMPQHVLFIAGIIAYALGTSKFV
jgi:hypothetical protein